jgi:tRNA A-37 threonylcarbamoyl transferase component Bud32
LTLETGTPEAGSVIANRFQLVHELGRGTMGTVWLANHLTLDVRCAVKFMTAEAAREPNYAARFALEARAIAQLQSPNIVRVLDYDMWEGLPFIAMEHLDGEDLAARLQRVGRLSPAETYGIVVQIARGLSRAHAAGIVHRDLKPENVFLAREGEDEVVKLVDFGIAKFEGRAGRRTQVGEVLGTPVYMSPEQARCAQTIDPRADLWSLAAIAFECLTGRLAFDGGSLADIFAKVMFEPMPVPSELAPDLPRGFDPWWSRAASRDPEGRFADAQEMADALGRALGITGNSQPPRLELVEPAAGVPAPGDRRRSMRRLGVIGLAVAVAVSVVVGARLDNGLARAAIHGRLRTAATTVLAPSALPPPESPSGAISGTASSDRQHADDPVALVPAPEPVPLPVPVAPASAVASAAAPAPAPAPESASTTVASAAGAAGAPEVRRVAAPARRSRVVVHREPRPVPAAMPPAPAEAQSGECMSGQRRCNGHVLQLCNVSLDGWTDFIDCGESALCDATSSGPCSPLGPGPSGSQAVPSSGGGAPTQPATPDPSDDPYVP